MVAALWIDKTCTCYQAAYPTLHHRQHCIGDLESKKEGGSDDEQEEKVHTKEDDASGESGDSDDDCKKKCKDDLQDLVRKVRFNLESLG